LLKQPLESTKFLHGSFDDRLVGSHKLFQLVTVQQLDDAELQHTLRPQLLIVDVGANTVDKLLCLLRCFIFKGFQHPAAEGFPLKTIHPIDGWYNVLGVQIYEQIADAVGELLCVMLIEGFVEALGMLDGELSNLICLGSKK